MLSTRFSNEDDSTFDTRRLRLLSTISDIDSETDLYYLQARYYDPKIGRFLSQDPYPINTQNPVELNRYVYAANSPVNFSDPSGLTLAETAILDTKTLTTVAVTGVVGAFVVTTLTAIVEALDKEVDVEELDEIWTDFIDTSIWTAWTAMIIRGCPVVDQLAHNLT